MNALSIRQPWAHCILHLGKDIENRTWKTLFRGTILIHAGTKLPPSDIKLVNRFISMRRSSHSLLPPKVSDYPLGAIVGTARILGCVIKSDSPWFEGPYGFILHDAKPLLHPIPMRGQLGIFKVYHPGILTELKRQGVSIT